MPKNTSKVICFKIILISALGFIAIDAVHGQVTQTVVPAPKSAPMAYRVWPSTPPKGCPYKQSSDIRGIGFTGKHAEYANADTWYPSWAADGNMYSPWTDGSVNGLSSSSCGVDATTGYATVRGDDPLMLLITDQGIWKSSPEPYGGRYPCGSLVYDGIWYYGTYCLMNEGGSNTPDVTTPTGRYNWGVLGPFVGFRYSRDFGKTWTETSCTPAKPIFPEPAKRGDKVKMGSPHFVDFGRNMQYSPDGKAYLVGHGAADPDPLPRPANASWITGDQVYIARVTPGPDTINDAKSYEFFGGNDASGKPVWTRDFARMKPLFDWNNHCGCVTMTYNAPLRKFLMCITDGWPTVETFDSYILESDNITGPWKMISYMRKFGEQGYFLNIPSKFISADGRTAWICYADNFTGSYRGIKIRTDPPGGRYGMCLQQIRLLAPSDPIPVPGALEGVSNLALTARVTSSSVHPDYTTAGATDGVVDGYPGDISHEWATNGETDSAMIRLTWSEEQTVGRVLLFDRPNELDRVLSGMLIFSDGSTIPVGALPDDAKTGLEVKFPPRKIRWVIFVITAVKPSSQNIGLSEIAVFER